MQETEEMTTFGSVWKRYEPVAELIRCKDCKHGRQYDSNAIDCEYRELATEPDWFCADGERRTDDV